MRKPRVTWAYRREEILTPLNFSKDTASLQTLLGSFYGSLCFHWVLLSTSCTKTNVTYLLKVGVFPSLHHQLFKQYEMKLCAFLIKNPIFLLNSSGCSHNNSSSPKSREDKHGSCQHSPTQGTLLSPSSCELNPAFQMETSHWLGFHQHCFKLNSCLVVERWVWPEFA